MPIKLCKFSFVRLLCFLSSLGSILFLEGCTNFMLDTPESMEDIVDKNIPLSPRGHGNLASQTELDEGLKQLRAKNYELASKSFNAAIRLSPQNSLYHYLNGLTYHLWGIEKNPTYLSNAEIGYKTALSLDPGNALASYNLGQLYMNSNSFKKAQDQFANALISFPNNPLYLFALAVSSYLCQDIETAVEAISALEKQGISNEEIYRAATLIYASAKNFTKAQENLNLLAQTDQTPESLLSYLKKRLLSWENFYSTLSNQTVNSTSEITQKPLDAPFKKSTPVSSKTKSKPSKPHSSSSKNSSSPSTSTSSSSASSVSSDPSSSLPFSLENELIDGEFALPHSQKMIVLNVMILRVERLETQSYGNNLLDVLNITAGYKNTQTGVPTPALGTSHDNSRTKPNIRTNNLSIGSLVYSLNIANDTTNHNEILATPSLIATHGQPSTFFSGTDYTLALTSTQGGGNLVSKEVGISLSVIPFFLQNGKIALKVNALRTIISTDPLPGNIVLVNTTPAFQSDKSSVSATTILSPGESLVLSGLTERTHIKSRDEAPFLGDLPVAGFFFSNDYRQVIERSILFIISPEFSEKIVKDAAGNWIVVPEEVEVKSPFLDRLKKLYPTIYSLPSSDNFLKELSEPQYSRNFRTSDMPVKPLTIPNLQHNLHEIEELTL
ncbi:MAG: hypothetical protein JSS34_02520 [Proteobacteria bacterium]|nr:hypothetical protein [Pseudomonadota bacterium]